MHRALCLHSHNKKTNLELALRAGLDLLGLGHSLDQLLDDDAVAVARVARVDLQVVVARYGVDFNLLLRGCGDGLVFDAQLLHARAVQLAQQTHDARFLSRARRTVHQEVREVSALHLKHNYAQCTYY